MKAYNYYKSLLPVLLLVLASCQKFLDVEPKGVVIPTTLADYEALLSAPLEITRTSNNHVFMTDEVVLPDAFRASANSYPGKGAVKAYDFDAELYESNEDDPDWNIAYRALYICNTVITGLENNQDNETAKRNRIKGEALVHRAYTLLTLVNLYAKHYNATSAATDPGVPMPLKPDINVQLPRATVNEVYNQIEKDLLEAANLLPEKPAYSYRPGKAAAYGTLARMYLYTGNWQQASANASKAFQLNNYIYDYNSFSWVNPANKALSALNGYPSSSKDMKDIVLLKYLNKAGGFGFVFLMSKDQNDLFATGDLRKEFGTSQKDWYNTVLPFQGIIENKTINNYNYGGITTSELLITRAEAQARMNNTQAALNDLDTLRKKRFTPASYKVLTAVTPAEALDLVLNERRLESAFTGLRLFDIKRLNLEGRNISVTHGSKTLTAGDPRFVLPIPAKVISLNPNIVQNQR